MGESLIWDCAEQKIKDRFLKYGKIIELENRISCRPKVNEPIPRYVGDKELTTYTGPVWVIHEVEALGSAPTYPNGVGAGGIVWQSYSSMMEYIQNSNKEWYIGTLDFKDTKVATDKDSFEGSLIAGENVWFSCRANSFTMVSKIMNTGFFDLYRMKDEIVKRASQYVEENRRDKIQIYSTINLANTKSYDAKRFSEAEEVIQDEPINLLEKMQQMLIQRMRINKIAYGNTEG